MRVFPLVASISYVVSALKFSYNSNNASSVSTARNAVAKQDLVKNGRQPGYQQAVNDMDLVFDFGFFNGMDSWAYLGQGLRVIAVEADPSLVAAAQQNPNFAPFLASGQLTLLNIAVAPAEQTAESWLPFYMNKCTKEWNSFYSGIGCRTCTPPYPENPAGCIMQNLLAKPCAQVLQQYGTPKYFKLDIEGAEPGCYHALSELPAASRPLSVSAEVGNDKLVDTLAAFGYKSFKLVRQQSGHSGSWGEGALDCKTAKLWRSVEGARAELQQIFLKGPVANDPCPGVQTGGSWYDLHASLSPHQTW